MDRKISGYLDDTYTGLRVAHRAITAALDALDDPPEELVRIAYDVSRAIYDLDDLPERRTYA